MEPVEASPDSLPDNWLAFCEVSDACWQDIDADDLAYLTGPRVSPGPCFGCGGRLSHSEACLAMQRLDSPELKHGKHKGKRLNEVPLSYLLWLKSKAGGELQELAEAEYADRKRPR